jgi:hypothetical protein
MLLLLDDKRPFSEGVKCFAMSSEMIVRFIGGDRLIPATPPIGSFSWYVITLEEEVGMTLLNLWPDPPLLWWSMESWCWPESRNETNV